LPGVIVEAYDSKNDVVFKFDGIEDISKMPKAAPQAASTEQQQHGVVIKMIGMDDDDADPTRSSCRHCNQNQRKGVCQSAGCHEKDPDAFVQSAMAASGNNLQGNNGPRPVIKIKLAKVR